MKVVFVSNYYNHHQAAVSNALYKLTKGQYVFIQTEEMETERKNLGWGGTELPSFVKCSYTDEKSRVECLRLIWEADLVIAGGSPTVEWYIQKRIKSGRLVFRYSERVYKNSRAEKQRLLRGIKYHLCNFPYKNVYLLSASAYAAADYAKTGNFIHRSYKWGYFPELKSYPDFDTIMAKKDYSTILWTARLIDWKHPELCLEIAKRLKADGYNFKINMIGNGSMEAQIRDQIVSCGLEDSVYLLGSMKPEEVREHMERAGIFMFTSDFNEGWGAVLNESMNSGCAVVASHAIGAAPYLLQDGVNGYLYKDGDSEDLYVKIKRLLNSPAKAQAFGRRAYNSLAEMWNAENAAERVVLLAEKILAGEKNPVLFENGPCSKAEVLQNTWYTPMEGGAKE